MSKLSVVFNYLSTVANYHDGNWIEQLYEFQVGEYESTPEKVLDAFENLSSYEKCELVRRLAIDGKQQIRTKKTR